MSEQKVWLGMLAWSAAAIGAAVMKGLVDLGHGRYGWLVLNVAILAVLVPIFFGIGGADLNASFNDWFGGYQVRSEFANCLVPLVEALDLLSRAGGANEFRQAVLGSQTIDTHGETALWIWPECYCIWPE